MMFHRVGRLCSSALTLLCAAAALTPAAAQTAIRTDAELLFVTKEQQAVPADFVIVRDGNGAAVTLLPGAQSGGYLIRDAGRKLSLEFTARSGKDRTIELLLEDAPKVFVTFVVDPVSGLVDEVRQKPYWPNSQPSKKAFRSGGRGSIGFGVPTNDACASPIAIVAGATAYDTTDATTDGPANGCGSGGQVNNDIWFSYLAPGNGTIEVSTCNTAAYDTVLAIYSGLTCPPAAPLSCNDDTPGCGLTSTTGAAVTGGQQYLIRVGGFGAASRGTGTLNLSFTGAGGGSNDECAGAVDVDCNDSVTFNNSTFTTAVTDPPYSCHFSGPLNQGVGTAWFTFMATGPNATLDTSASAVSDTLLAVYSGTCGALVEIGCDDDSGTGLRSLVNVGGLTAGTTYYVQVSSFSAASLGSITLDITCAAGGADGDECDEAIDIVCGSTATFDNTFFTTDPMDPGFSCHFSGPGLQGVATAWLKFVATDTSARIDTNASTGNTDTLLAVYDGTCGSFTELACSEDEGVGLLSELCVEGLVVGNTYYIQVASFSAFDVGSTTVTIECPCPAAPDNDDCEDAEAIALPANIFLDNSLATDDIGVPCGVASGPFKNVWYLVSGTGSTLTATTCNAGTVVTDTKLSVFCADCGELVCVAGNDDDCAAGGPVFSSTVSWCSQAGANYLVTVGNFSASTVAGVINLEVFDTGSGCVADVSCLPEGACCLADGSCVTTTEGDCLAQGGEYGGDGTACTTNFVTDGSFEGGAFGGNWTEFSSNFGTPLCDPGSCGFGGGTGPHTGDWWAWFGGIAAPETGSLEQAITIPVGSTTIDFWLEIPVSSGNGVDFLRFSVDGNVEFSVLESAGPAIGYTLVQVPIGAYADGGVHTIRFDSVITGAPNITNFFVDDVSLNAVTFDCTTCTTLDFTTEDDGVTPLGNGQVIDTEFGVLVSISGAGPNNGPAIFDSNPAGPNNPSQDLDLLVNRGNVLILQNSSAPAAVGGFYPRPNDAEAGGSLIFDFATASAPMSVVLIDIDDAIGEDSSVVLTDVGGATRTYTVPANWTGEASWLTLDLTTLAAQPGFGSVATAVEGAGFDGNAVVRIRVNLGSSGAVDDLSFCE
jgi:hypothetical protein